jgi:hypothetical protein
MSNMKKIPQTLKKFPWLLIGIVCLFLLLALAIVKGNLNSNQAVRPTGANIYFEGEYSIDGGSWHKIEKEEHIPATQGDVTLRGRFHMESPDGQYLKPAGKGSPIAFFLDHINVKIYESGQRPYEMFHENPKVGSASCGEIWLAYRLLGDTDEPIEIVIHNPHRFGNETAVDDLISGVNFWSGIDFEESVLSSGDSQRYMGLLLCI